MRTHRTCVFGYGRRNDGPAMSVVYYVPTDADDGDNPANGKFDLELDREDLDRLQGDFDRVDGNGEVVNTCDVDLDLLSDLNN